MTATRHVRRARLVSADHRSRDRNIITVILSAIYGRLQHECGHIGFRSPNVEAAAAHQYLMPDLHALDPARRLAGTGTAILVSLMF